VSAGVLYVVDSVGWQGSRVGAEAAAGSGWMWPVTSSWDEEFHPSAGARSTLQWASEHGASTLGEAYDLLDQLAVSNDIPEVLGHDDTVEGVREELEIGIELLGADAELTSLP
jgi:hypothetical protein